MGDMLHSTLKRPDGTLVWEGFHHRSSAIHFPSVNGSSILQTVDHETGKPEQLIEYDVDGRTTQARFNDDGSGDMCALDARGECLLKNPLDSGVRLEVKFPFESVLMPGEELRSMGSIRWKEVPLAHGFAAIA